MSKSLLTRRMFAAAALVTSAILATSVSHAGGHQKVESIHFLIPGGAGGGWDGTARGTGEALTKSGLVGSATYENMSGGGGGKAIGYLIENAKSNHGTLMVNSTPIVIRSLTKVFPQNFRDLTLVAGTIGDYAALVVPSKSDIKSMGDLVTAYKANPTEVKYVAYDAGGKAMAGLLSGEIKALSTGFSEAVSMAKAGEVNIIGVTSNDRVSAYPDAKTMKEQGINTSFINWRGFFAAPGLPKDKLAAYQGAIEAMYKTAEWEAVRSRNGWENIHNPGDQFRTFLEQQEKEIADLMKKLGFL
jgi:putative tricarboxylic transport membrane protein